MNQREKEVLRLEENFKDTLENELASQQSENKKVSIVDIKLVGSADWKDKISGKSISENVFIVEKEINEIDENGKERKTVQESYYLGDKCIGGRLGDGDIIYNPSIEISEPDKIMAVKSLLDRVSQEEIDSNSLNALQRKELAEVLSAYLGREILDDELDDVLNELEADEQLDLDEDELDELEQDDEKEDGSEDNQLSDKKAEKIKISAIQKVDLNKLVDGKETLKQRLDLNYDVLYVIPSEKVKEISPEAKVNNTAYTLIGDTEQGEKKVLDDEFEMDRSVGNSASKKSTKIRENGIATRDNKDLSVYTRKSNGASIGCENNKGNVDMFFYPSKTVEENENVGIQVETSKTRVIPIESREIMNRSKGIEQKDKVRDEVEEHTEEGCNPDEVKDFDGIEETSSHEHLAEEIIDEFVEEIFNYENNQGEEMIKEAFTKDEIKDRLLREMEKNQNKNLTVEEIVSNLQDVMNRDAEFSVKMHKR